MCGNVLLLEHGGHAAQNLASCGACEVDSRPVSERGQPAPSLQILGRADGKTVRSDEGRDDHLGLSGHSGGGRLGLAGGHGRKVGRTLILLQ
jgi:hypothetical protein